MLSFSEQKRLLLDEDMIRRADIIRELDLIRDRFLSLSEFSRGDECALTDYVCVF